MHWFESFAFGRVANRAVRLLGDLSLRGVKQVPLKPFELMALRFLTERVLTAPPLTLTPACLKSWVVFTDGACEGPDNAKIGSIGGVLISPDGVLLQFFGGVVPSQVMGLLMGCSKNPIYELEVMPVLVAMVLWGTLCHNSQVCWYLDNEAGSSAFLKAFGATAFADNMVSQFADKEMAHAIKSWFARVPSASNVADPPSRCEDSYLRDRGAVKAVIDWMVVRETMIAELSNRGGCGSRHDVSPMRQKRMERE